MKNSTYFINQQIQNNKTSLLFGHYSNRLQLTPYLTLKIRLQIVHRRRATIANETVESFTS